MGLIEMLSQPWHWAVSGIGIVFVVFLLLWLGGEFGVSSNFRTICAMSGAGKTCEFFDFKWRDNLWNLVFLAGSMIGGFIAINWLSDPNPVLLSMKTQTFLSSSGVETPLSENLGLSFVPNELFSLNSPKLFRNVILLILGGFFVGFGSRYAGGCTSGHAISGLSNLQLPSLIAVIGFFIGGMAMAWVILPYFLSI